MSASIGGGWGPLPQGSFTGIDWSKPGAIDGADPYLVWAEAEGFAGFAQSRRDWLPVAVELHRGCTIDQLATAVAGSSTWLRVPGIYRADVTPRALRFCTARVRRQFFVETARGGRLHSIVKRIELGLPARSDADDPTRESADHWPVPSPCLGPARANSAQPPIKGKVLGLIDDSLAVAHANFLDASGAPRTAFLWRQDEEGFGHRPVDTGYGHELTSADIGAAMEACTTRGVVDEAATYTALGLSGLGNPHPGGRVRFLALDRSASHGTHVMDLLGGPRTLAAGQPGLPPDFCAPPTWARTDDEASRASIVAVQLDRDTVDDTSGGSMNVHVLDGLLYILSRCDARAKIVVNISFGTLAGPHDGTSILEAAMDDLLALCKGRLEIVLAAGNSYQLRTHTNVVLEKDKPQALHWRIQPDDRTQSFLELWIGKGSEDVDIVVTPPDRASLAPMKIGGAGLWTDDGATPLCALIYPKAAATGSNGTCALLAVAPTFRFGEGLLAPAGAWRVELINRSTTVAVVDGYIERDDVVAGARTGARQSHFEDAAHGPARMQYDMDAFVDDPARTTPIRRSGNFSSIATGHSTRAVGGVLIADSQAWARYSPLGHDPDANRPERAGVVKIPDANAYSDETRSSRGVLAAGSRSSSRVKLAGTSAAAPQVARDILNRM